MTTSEKRLVDMSWNGADIIVQTLAEAGVDTCFANPGTTEMHLVAALGRTQKVRTHLCLFEGVATGAADGYSRMTQRPAATLLHLGPGLANGMANLHNAKKAQSRIINIVGEHATSHLGYNAPLTADIASMAATVSDKVVSLTQGLDIVATVNDLYAKSSSGGAPVATLIVPNDIAWGQAESISPKRLSVCPQIDQIDRSVDQVTAMLQREGSALIIGAPFITARSAALAAAIGTKTGARIVTEAAVARMERGRGRVSLSRIPFHVDLALDALKEVRCAVLAGANEPVAFFAYPGRPSRLLPDSCEVHQLSGPAENLESVLGSLADHLGIEPSHPRMLDLPPLPANGAVTPQSLALVVANSLPDDAIVVDESITSGGFLFSTCANAKPHDWINNRGGSIGYSWPVAIGAAVACPQRRVFAVTGDGSAFYTLQSLWTMARSKLKITIIVLANRRYNILANEMNKIGAGVPSERATPLLSLESPAPDWLMLAKGQGVAATRVETTDELSAAMSESLSYDGPMLIEVVL